MGNTSSSHKISAQDRAILDLKLQRDKIQQYQKRIVAVTDRETEIARQCLARGEKSKALLALRRKKYQESLLSKTDRQLQQLQELADDVDFASIQQGVLFGIQQGTKVLKLIQAEIGGLESVEKLMSESEDAQAYQREISDMLSGKMSNSDEDDVEDELDALEKEVTGTAEQSVPSLPEVPRADLTRREEEDEAREQQRKARARARAREQASPKVAEPMMA